MDDLELPAFLVIPQADRKAAWKDRKLTRVKPDKPQPWGVPKTMNALAWKLKREQDEERERHKQQRLAMLRALTKK